MVQELSFVPVDCSGILLVGRQRRRLVLQQAAVQELVGAVLGEERLWGLCWCILSFPYERWKEK